LNLCSGMIPCWKKYTSVVVVVVICMLQHFRCCYL
jgi:hypothetical protein